MRAGEGASASSPGLRDLHSLHPQRPRANGVLSTEAQASKTGHRGKVRLETQVWGGQHRTEATVMEFGESKLRMETRGCLGPGGRGRDLERVGS